RIVESLIGNAMSRDQQQRARRVQRGIRSLFIVLLACLRPLASWAAEPVTAAELRDKARAVLSRLDGELVVPGLRERVEGLRDRWGVPHIYARNQEDLFFARGFVCAQDRLFQMDLWRRLARGETAELLGKDRLEGDRLARLLRYRGDLDAEWDFYGRDT